MITTSGNLFHIDFGHFLGNIKHFMVISIYTRVLMCIIPPIYRNSSVNGLLLFSRQTSHMLWEERWDCWYILSYSVAIYRYTINTLYIVLFGKPYGTFICDSFGFHAGQWFIPILQAPVYPSIPRLEKTCWPHHQFVLNGKSGDSLLGVLFLAHWLGL